MKTTKEKKETSTVEELRQIRDKIGSEIKDMTYDQLKEYINSKLSLHNTSVWPKGVE
jgi:hypothetical protein